MIELRVAGAQVLFSDRAAGDVREADAAAELSAITARRLAHGRQVHGTVVRTVRAGRELDHGVDCDGHATDATTVAPTVLVADCLPIAIAAVDAVAMVHAGWRGLDGGVIEAGAEALRRLGATGPLAAAIGPGAGPCCYEVGDDLRERFGSSEPTLDLKAIARRRLAGAGVDRVEDVGICTVCDDRYFSYRRDGEAAGRQAGVAWLPG
jgi:purine-nucleoside/S-methyl-5'-thioadenosine phosphorylase / adenosine deaminase